MSAVLLCIAPSRSDDSSGESLTVAPQESKVDAKPQGESGEGTWSRKKGGGRTEVRSRGRSGLLPRVLTARTAAPGADPAALY